MHKIFLVRLSGAEHKREIESFKNFEAELQRFKYIQTV